MSTQAAGASLYGQLLNIYQKADGSVARDDLDNLPKEMQDKIYETVFNLALTDCPSLMNGIDRRVSVIYGKLHAFKDPNRFKWVIESLAPQTFLPENRGLSVQENFAKLPECLQDLIYGDIGERTWVESPNLHEEFQDQAMAAWGKDHALENSPRLRKAIDKLAFQALRKSEKLFQITEWFTFFEQGDPAKGYAYLEKNTPLLLQSLEAWEAPSRYANIEPHILSQIFEFFGPESTPRASCVSKAWHREGMHPILWEGFGLSVWQKEWKALGVIDLRSVWKVIDLGRYQIDPIPEQAFDLPIPIADIVALRKRAARRTPVLIGIIPKNLTILNELFRTVLVDLRTHRSNLTVEEAYVVAMTGPITEETTNPPVKLENETEPPVSTSGRLYRLMGSLANNLWPNRATDLAPESPGLPSPAPVATPPIDFMPRVEEAVALSFTYTLSADKRAASLKGSRNHPFPFPMPCSLGSGEGRTEGVFNFTGESLHLFNQNPSTKKDSAAVLRYNIK